MMSMWRELFTILYFQVRMNQIPRKPLPLAVATIITPTSSPQWPLVTNIANFKWNSTLRPNTALPNNNSLPLSPTRTPLSPSGPLFNKPGQSSQQIRGVQPTTVPIDFAESVDCTILSLVEKIRILRFTRPVPRVFAKYSSSGPIHTITESESDALQ